MKYVSRIVSYRDGDLPWSLYRSCNPMEYISLGIRELDGPEEFFSTADIAGLVKSGCLGYADRVTPLCSAAVCYDKKTVQVLKHIESITVSRDGTSDWAMTDTVVLNHFGRPSHSVEGRPRLTIELGEDSVTLAGVANSVVVWRQSEVYNLYDFLGMMCHLCELNILQYHTIRLYTRAGENTTMTVIKLKSDTEAVRFFTKMWMDVCKR